MKPRIVRAFTLAPIVFAASFTAGDVMGRIQALVAGIWLGLALYDYFLAGKEEGK